MTHKSFDIFNIVVLGTQCGETNMYNVLSACCLVDSVDRVLDKYLYGLVRTS